MTNQTTDFQTPLSHLEKVSDEDVYAINKPDKNLLPLYIIYALSSTVFFPIVFLPLYFKFKTLRYTFHNDGLSISYGILWRRESYLTYSRIQDIHVTRNIFERWLGVGTVAIQTAGGSANAEEAIIGVREFEMIRNFLYSRMRGVHHKKNITTHSATTTNVPSADNYTSDEIRLLTTIADDLHAVRSALIEVRRDTHERGIHE